MSETTVVHLSTSARLVAEALAEDKQSTVRTLADAARVSKSTVAKTLAALERSDAAIRTVREDDGVRDADLWSPGPTLGALLFTAAAGAPRYGHAETLATATETAAGLHPSDVSADGDVAEELEGHTTAAALAPGQAATECTKLPSSSATGDDAASGGEQGCVPKAASLADSVAATGTVTTTPSEPGESMPCRRTGRLAAGELAAMVAAVLASHPDIEYTPTMLSHLLGGRSSGAVHNVLEKMIKAGAAVRTCEKPKRYRHAAGQASNGS